MYDIIKLYFNKIKIIDDKLLVYVEFENDIKYKDKMSKDGYISIDNLIYYIEK